MQKLRFGAQIVLASAVLAACSSTPVAQAPANPAPTTAPMPATGNSGSSKPEVRSTVAGVVLPPHLDPRNPISTERSIYFEFDLFTIKPEYLKLIERHGSYLAAKPALSVRIEGNADERGSSEYNLALGQKRAQSVLQALKTFGVTDGRMEAVSWGKERPMAAGHDEANWAQNRRADIVYPKQ